ncbi:MAG: hypothetical protein ACI4ET_00225 [Bilifractor sp.]
MKRKIIQIQKKIRSEKGASLSVALLFFLVCAIVGSVIVAAATSSMGRMKDLSVNEKEKNAVYSTARLVARRMGGQNLVDSDILPDLLKDSTSASGTTGDGSSNSIVLNSSDNTLTVSTSFTFYRKEKSDGSVSFSDTENGTYASVSEGNAYPGEVLPASPFSSLNSKIASQKDLGFTGYEKVRACQIIDAFWSSYILSDDGKLGQSVTDFSLDNAYDWKGDNVPSNHTWMYGHIGADTTIDSLLEAAHPCLTRQTYVMTVQGDQSDKNPVSVCIDLYMDKNLNLEAQIYPETTDSNGTAVSFKNADNRCLVKIPANAGELQYDQDEDAALIKTDQDEDIYQVKMTRSVILGGFGWGAAKIYTGSAITAQNPAGS